MGPVFISFHSVCYPWPLCSAYKSLPSYNSFFWLPLRFRPKLELGDWTPGAFFSKANKRSDHLKRPCSSSMAELWLSMGHLCALLQASCFWDSHSLLVPPPPFFFLTWLPGIWWRRFVVAHRRQGPSLDWLAVGSIWVVLLEKLFLITIENCGHEWCSEPYIYLLWK